MVTQDQLCERVAELEATIDSLESANEELAAELRSLKEGDPGAGISRRAALGIGAVGLGGLLGAGTRSAAAASGSVGTAGNPVDVYADGLTVADALEFAEVDGYDGNRVSLGDPDSGVEFMHLDRADESVVFPDADFWYRGNALNDVGAIDHSGLTGGERLESLVGPNLEITSDNELAAASGGRGTMDGVYDVTDYGAAGDGSTDDTTAIQDALDTVSADGGGVLFFPPGTYYITGTVLIPSDVTLRGAGMGNSTLYGEPNDTPVLEFDNCSNVELRDLTFTCESAPDNTRTWYFYGTVDNVLFHQCQWRDLPRQAAIFRGSNYLITNCRIENTGRDGFLFVSVDRPVVVNNYFYRTGDDSIAFNVDTTNSVAADNVIEESGYHHAGGGVKQHGTNSVVTGNVFIRPKTYAIRIQNPDENSIDEGSLPRRVVFSDNIINGMNEVGGDNNYAIEVKEMDGSALLYDNIIYTFDGAMNKRGINIRGDGPTTNVHIDNCHIVNHPDYNSRYAITLEDNADHLRISNCGFHDTSDAVYKRSWGGSPTGICEIRDCLYDISESKQLFDCDDDDGFEVLRVMGNSSKSTGSPLVDCGGANFDLVQVYNNLARGHSTVLDDTSQVNEVVTGPL